MITGEAAVAVDLNGCRQIVEALRGQTVTRVCIEPWSVRLLFDSAELHIEGAWRLVAADGAVIDHGQPLGERRHFELWRLAGGTVEQVDCADTTLPGFRLQISRGWRLEFFADDDGLDDWSLAMPNAKIFYNGPNLTVFS